MKTSKLYKEAMNYYLRFLCFCLSVTPGCIKAEVITQPQAKETTSTSLRSTQMPISADSTQKDTELKSFLDSLKERKVFFKEPGFATYLSAIEWRNVEIEAEKGEYLLSGASFIHYPYFHETAKLCGISIKSFSEGYKVKESNSQFLFSDITLTNGFVYTMTSAELIATGLVTLPLRIIFKNEHKSSFSQKIAKIQQDYANSLNKKPFFTYPFFSDIPIFTQAFYITPEKSFQDIPLASVYILQWAFRGVIAFPINYFYSMESNKIRDNNQVILEIPSSISKSELTSLLNQSGIRLIEVSQEEDSSNSNRPTYHALCSFPRYKELTQSIMHLYQHPSSKSINIKTIDGHDFIQLKQTYLGNNKKGPNLTQPGYEILFEYKSTTGDKTYQEIRVDLNKDNVLHDLDENSLLHDF